MPARVVMVGFMLRAHTALQSLGTVSGTPDPPALRQAEPVLGQWGGEEV